MANTIHKKKIFSISSILQLILQGILQICQLMGFKHIGLMGGVYPYPSYMGWSTNMALSGVSSKILMM